MISQKAIEAANLDDLLFLNRNKAYGAYELRKNYDKRLTAALTAAVSFLILAIFLLNHKPDNPKSVSPIINDKPDSQIVIIRDYTQEKETKGTKFRHHILGKIIPKVTNEKDDTFKNKPKMEKIENFGNGIDNFLKGKDDEIGESNGLLGSIHTLKPEEPKVFDKFPDVNAEFPGGEAAYENYLKTNINYPIFAVDNHIEGTIFLSLKIDETGRVVGVNVLKKIGGGCDEEAVRALRAMPKWKPGEKNGKKIAVIRYVKVRMELR